MSDAAAGPLDGSSSRTSPHPGRPLRDDAARRPRRGGGQGGGRAATTPAPGPHRSTTASRRTTSGSTATSGPSSSTSPTSPTPPWPASWPAAPTSSSRTSAPAGSPKYGLDYDTVAASNPRRVCVDQRVRQRRGGPGPAGYDLIVQAISGLMSLAGPADGEPYRAGISVFDVMAGLHATIGLLAALHRRHETGRGQHVEVNLLSSALSGMVNHQRLRRRGRRAVPDGQQPPEPVPLRAASLLRRRAHRHRRQRPAVPGWSMCSVCRAGRRPAVREEPRPDGAPPRAAPSSSNGCRPGPGWSGSATSSTPGSRADRSTPWTRASPSRRTSGSTRSSTSGRTARRSVCPQPHHALRDPAAYRLPPPTLDEHGAEIRRWLSEEVSP